MNQVLGEPGVGWTRCWVDQVLDEPGVGWTRCWVNKALGEPVYFVLNFD